MPHQFSNNIMKPSCAFCASFIFRPTYSGVSAKTQTKVETTFIGGGFKRYPFQPVSTTTSTPKRQRTRQLTTCAFNNNRNNEGLNQVADALISAGQFFQSTSGQIILWGGLVWLVVTGRIGVLFDSFLILFAIVTIVPVIALLGFRWWINRQVVRGTCPSCGANVTSLRGQTFQCTSCGSTMQDEDRGNFSVKDPSSATIDIDAKEISDV